MYPAKLVPGFSPVVSPCVVGVDVGGSVTGAPVRECRNGGMIDVDCVKGERMRRRRGLEIWDCDLD